MKRLSFLVIAAVLALTGCTHTRTVDLFADEAYSTINRLGARKTATVTFRDNQYTALVLGQRTLTVGRQIIEVRSLQVTPDSTSWYNVKTERFETVATDQIREIRFSSTIHRVKSALEGLGIGLLTGVTAGYIYGAAQGDDPSCDDDDSWFCLTAEGKAKLYGIFYGGAAGALGLIVGAAVGHRDIYRFEAPSPAPQVASENVEWRREQRLLSPKPTCAFRRYVTAKNPSRPCLWQQPDAQFAWLNLNRAASAALPHDTASALPMTGYDAITRFK